MTQDTVKPRPTAEELVHESLKVPLFSRRASQRRIMARFSKGTTPLVVVVGPNASGKSLFRRIVSAVLHRDYAGIEFMGISMEHRRSGGFERAFVYGSEEWQATGVNSAATVTMGITTCRGRERLHVIFWDEPDLGLSDEHAAGMGQTLADFARNPGHNTCAAFAVTHNRHLLRELIPAQPHYLCLGTLEYPTLQSWVDREVRPASLESLHETGRATFKKVQPILDQLKKK